MTLPRKRSRRAWIISDDTRGALERCDLFRDLTREQLMQVAALVEEQSIRPEELLLRQGDAAANIFVVVEGLAVAQLQLDRGMLSLGLAGPGDVAGWSSLAGVPVYPATVKALTSMRVARIRAEGLTLLLNTEPEIGYQVHRRLSTIFYRQYVAALQALKTSG